MFHSASMWRLQTSILQSDGADVVLSFLPSFRHFSMLGSYQRWIYFTAIQSDMKSLIMRGKNDPSLSRTGGTGRLAVSYWTRQSGQVSFNLDPEPPPLSSRTASGEVFDDST